MVTRARRPLAALAALLLLAGCGDAVALPPGGERAAYPDTELTWVSQDGDRATLHRGEEEQPLPSYVEELAPTAYGYVVRHRTGADVNAPSRLVLVDGDDTEVVPGDPTGLRVSPDGRYAGWIDEEGPRRVGYRLAEAVVVDLATGEEVLRDHDDMGGWFDQDLYGNQWPTFLGFDAEGAAYWETAEADDDGTRVRRLDLATGEVEAVEGDAERVLRRSIVDPATGVRTGLGEDGRPSPDGEGVLGYVSADGRWCLAGGAYGPLQVTDCASGTRVTPDYPARERRFAGWTEDPDAFWVLATDGAGLQSFVPPDEPDDTRGVLARCQLPSGACTVERRVTRLGSIVLPGMSPL